MESQVLRAAEEQCAHIQAELAQRRDQLQVGCWVMLY